MDEHFEDKIPDLKKQIMGAFHRTETQSGYRSVWEDFEDVISPVLTRFLTKPPFNIPEENIQVAKSKSVYPDFKIIHDGKLYAIDVKSGEDSKNPWYDIGRLDTYEEKHLDKYAAEYSIVVRWFNKDLPEVVDVYIEPTYRTAGYREEYDGVLYRPYDGKLRPKSWADFESEHTNWKTKADFKVGLHAAKMHRRMRYIIEWYEEMTEKQREQLRSKLHSIDITT